MRSENIYIVLVRANTLMGRITRKLFQYDYTHVAISLEKDLDRLITFSRRRHYTPFDCGYMIENINCYAYGKNKNVKLKIFKVPVRKDSKQEIEKYIDMVSKDKSYTFNFYSMLTMPIVHGFRIYKAHNCMSFVSKILKLSKEIEFNKEYYKYNIQDIDILLSDYLVEESFFSKEGEDDKNYMSMRGILWNIVLFLLLNIKLLYRIIFKRRKMREEKW